MKENTYRTGHTQVTVGKVNNDLMLLPNQVYLRDL